MCWIPPTLCAPQQPSLGPAPPFALPPYTAFEPLLTATVAANQPHQDYPAYIPPTPHAADFRQPAAASVTPLTAAIPPPGSLNIIGEEGELLDNGPLPPTPILQLYIPDISEEEETLFKDKEDDSSIGEVKQIIASIDVARVSSQDVENCWDKRGGAHTGLKIIAYGDLLVGDVTCTVHRLTSLDADARLIPPRIDKPCLSVLGDTVRLFVLVWNFADHLGTSLKIFDGGDEGRRSTIRCSFDPGGDTSPKLLISTLLVVSWFPP